MAYDGDNCTMCAGCGEMDLPDVQRLGPVPCPECVSGELHDRIAELEAALAPNGAALALPMAGDVDVSIRVPIAAVSSARKLLKQTEK